MISRPIIRQDIELEQAGASRQAIFFIAELRFNERGLRKMNKP